MSQPSERRALLWVALGASLWGTDTVFRRPLTADLTSAQIVLIEHLILSIVLAIPLWSMRSQWLALSRKQWGAVLGIGWGGSALASICFTEAIKIGNPTTAVLLQKSQPIFAAVLAWLLLGERLGGRFWICLLLALCGAYVVNFGIAAPGAGIDREAALLAISAAALWGASTVLGRFVLDSLSFAALTGLRIFAAMPLLILLNGMSALSVVLNVRQAFSLALVALVPGLLALLVYYRGLGHARASRAAVAELSFAATATLLNWIFLGARISAIQLAGFGLLWIAILNLNRRDEGEVDHAESERQGCVGIPQ